MDLLKQTFESFSPNFEKLTKYTITLGDRQWETTSSVEAWRFMLSFNSGDPFNFKSKKHSGSPINTVVNVKQ